MNLHIDNFDYPFDPLLIAQHPLSERGKSRLLVLRRENKGALEHRQFSELTDYLHEGDLLVLNNTKVIPCRLKGRKSDTGKEIELLLIKELAPDTWEALGKGKLKTGTRINFSSSCFCDIVDHEEGTLIVKFFYTGKWEDVLSDIGSMPIPPYIKRLPVKEDREWYQTVYACREGAIAAPTAGLHFTEEMMRTLSSRGIQTAFITLHVGKGTFLPFRTESIEDHKMEPEWFEVGDETVEMIRAAKAGGGRVVAVGTTSVRALEQAAAGGELKAQRGETGLFIRPGYSFKVVDAMVTNFHLPKSTLLMLVMAFAGRENILKAYGEAVRMKYRFYSYGDAMLIL